MDLFGNIVFINLDVRADRKELLLNELNKLNISSDISNNIIRFSAIKRDNGAIGCSESHIEVLKMAIEKKMKKICVLEDDFTWKANSDYITSVLNNFYRQMGNEWDVLILGASIYNLLLEGTNMPGIVKVRSAQTTTAYIVNGSYLPKLLENFKEGLKLFKETGWDGKYAVDQYWKRLQATDRWYMTYPGIGRQRENYSDIERRDVNYQFV